MKAFRRTPHSVTGETANLMMLGRELRLPDQLKLHPPPLEVTPQNEYCQELLDRLEVTHAALREQQRVIRQEDQKEPLLFSPGDMVWLENRRRRKGENPKLQAKFQGPYTVTRSWPNHTYQIERSGQTSIQNECRLKAYRPCPEEVGRAPVMLEPNRRPNMRGAIKRRERAPSPEPWMLSPMHPPVLEPPTQQQGRQQADQGPVQVREREVTRTEATERKFTDTTAEGNPEERPPKLREPTGPNPPLLEPQIRTPTKINSEDYLVTATRKKQEEPEDKEKNKCYLIEEEKFGKNGNQAELFSCAQEVSLAHEYAQKSTPFCKRANLNQEVSCCKSTNSCKYTLSVTEMDKENIQPPAQDKEASLEALLEVAMMETANDKAEEEKMPWWLTEESLLGNVELDYSVENVPSTSTMKEEKKATHYLINRDSKPAVLEEKLIVKEEATKKIKDNKKINIQAARISRKEMSQQGHATEDGTPREGLSAGAGPGEKESAVIREEVREQSMGLCTVQMIRLVDNPSPRASKVEQLWWVTPETEEKVKDLIEGDDITQQWCIDCGFKGTRKRVKIHCMQHHCKYLCECVLIKSSRDAIYDHQVSKGRAEEHGGAKRRIYCVDKASYPALCSVMAWEDPPLFGEARPIEGDA